MSTVVYRAPREWTRVHPVTPYLGSGGVLGLALFYVIYQVSPRWLVSENEGFDEISRLPVVYILLGLVGIVAVLIGFSYLSWTRNEFRLGDDALYHRKGLLMKQLRQARLDRIEAVDVVQPLIARLFGLAQLKVEVAGGQGSGIDLKYLRLGDAEALRNEVLSLRESGAPGASAEPGADGALGQGQDARPASLRDLGAVVTGERSVAAVREAPEREVYSVPPSRLALSLLYSGASVWLVALALAALGSALLFQVDVVAAIAAIAGTSVVAIVTFFAALFGFYWGRFNGGFGFTASVSADGLRLRHGLTQTRRQTVVPGRVQAVKLAQPLLWRRRGWWRITINVAGYQDDQEHVSTLLPVGTLDDALLALWLVLPESVTRDAEGLAARALLGSGDDDGFTPTPVAARILDPWQWRRRGVLSGDDALYIRRGRFERELIVVPHGRVQSTGLTQGYLQRLRGLATVHLHSTPGPVAPVAAHLATADAFALVDSEARRARAARARQSVGQWVAAVDDA